MGNVLVCVRSNVWVSNVLVCGGGNIHVGNVLVWREVMSRWVMS